MDATTRASRRWPVRRFVVRDRSMEPALFDGQRIVAVRSRRATVGQVRVFEHPYRAGFWLVKRVAEVLGDGRMRVISDNLEATDGGDSRDFGALPISGSYRVLLLL